MIGAMSVGAPRAYSPAHDAERASAPAKKALDRVADALKACQLQHLYAACPSFGTVANARAIRDLGRCNKVSEQQRVEVAAHLVRCADRLTAAAKWILALEEGAFHE